MPLALTGCQAGTVARGAEHREAGQIGRIEPLRGRIEGFVPGWASAGGRTAQA